MDKDPFEEYLKAAEPNKRIKGYAWNTAIGLQAVDGLEPSEYLLHTACRNIEGEISFNDAHDLLQAYYENNPSQNPEDRTEEADKVSLRIAETLADDAFTFSPNGYLYIHKKLFDGIYPHAGQYRNYNITKKEWILDGATVLYGNAPELREALAYDFAEESSFSYSGLTVDEIVHHLAIFISKLWQIHIFGEGNTRTTAVFLIKYLRKLGFKVTNDIFANNAWYFRNSLVRANYSDLTRGIHETPYYLELFLRNLLLGENHPLRNRALHISKMFSDKKADIRDAKPDIECTKPDIECTKPDIESLFKPKTAKQIKKLYHAFSDQKVFGRSDVMNTIEVKSSRASDLLKELLSHELIEPVTGYGKGKYRFR